MSDLPQEAAKRSVHVPRVPSWLLTTQQPPVWWAPELSENPTGVPSANQWPARVAHAVCACVASAFTVRLEERLRLRFGLPLSFVCVSAEETSTNAGHS